MSVGCRLVLALLLPAAAVLAADLETPKPSVIDEVLRREKSGAVDRREALKAAVEAQQTEALWQAGFVQTDGRWVSFDQQRLDGKRRDQKDRYVQRRSTLQNTRDGHLSLANWCRQEKLPDLEHAHLHAAVALSPEADNRELLSRMGYQQVGDVWLSPEELAEWKAQLDFTTKSLKIWQAKLELAAGQLTSKGRKYQAGLTTLDGAASPIAVPALEYVLCGQGESVAVLGVERLGRIPGHESTIALARQAVFNKHPAVRDKAAALLADRKLEDFVPGLLGLLVSPIEMRSSLSGDVSRGTFVQNLLLARETQDQFQVRSLETVREYYALVWRQGPKRFELHRPDSSNQARVANDGSRALADREFAVKKSIENENAFTSELNARTIAVLSRVTGENSRATPRDWWDWWSEYNQYAKDPKPVRKVAQNQVERSIAEFRVQKSCLVAGTPVWTEGGPRPVETIAVGDRLLSQDLESGELIYLPVLQTTVRPPTEVVRLSANGETLTATGGHRFWASGEGWLRANDLQPGMRLRTATGTAEITANEPAGEAAVYNVVIASTHNYFVGKSACLTHDVTLPKPTNRKVPGLTE